MTLDARDLVGYHFSVDFFKVLSGVVVGGITSYFNFSINCLDGGFEISTGSTMVILYTTYFSPIFLPIGILRATCLSKISSCVSKNSSICISLASGSGATAASVVSTCLGGIVSGVCFF